MKRLALCAALSIFPLVSAHAQSNYASLNLSYVTIEDDALASDVTVPGISAVAGTQLTPFLGVEARLGTSASDTVRGMGSTVDLQLQYHAGVYVRGTYELGQATAYALAGVTRTSLDIKVNGESAFVTLDRLSYGAGLQLLIDPRTNTYGVIEYINYLDKDDTTISAISIGALMRF